MAWTARADLRTEKLHSDVSSQLSYQRLLKKQLVARQPCQSHGNVGSWDQVPPTTSLSHFHIGFCWLAHCHTEWNQVTGDRLFQTKGRLKFQKRAGLPEGKLVRFQSQFSCSGFWHQPHWNFRFPTSSCQPFSGLTLCDNPLCPLVSTHPSCPWSFKCYITMVAANWSKPIPFQGFSFGIWSEPTLQHLIHIQVTGSCCSFMSQFLNPKAES